MVAQNRESNRVGLEIAHAKDKIYLVDDGTGDFLHLSGSGRTRNPDWAWLGFKHQAETLKQRAKASGSDFPFRPVHRRLVEEQRA